MSRKTLLLGWLCFLQTISTVDCLAQSDDKGKKAPLPQMMRMPHELKHVAAANGDRLTLEGKERLTLTGEVKNSLTNLTQNLFVTREEHDKLRVDLANGDKLILNGTELVKGGSTVAFSEKLVESIFEDFPDTFFLNFTSEKKAVLLAGRARPENTNATTYTGPFYNIYGVGRDDRLRTNRSRINKLYFLNFDTHLLERVTYKIPAGVGSVEVMTLFEDYRKVDDQLIPFRIRRLENGVEVIQITIRTASVSKKQADNAFKSN